MKIDVLQKAKELLKRYPGNEGSDKEIQMAYTAILEFLRIYSGENSEFYQSIPKGEKLDFRFMYIPLRACVANLEAFISHLEAGLVLGMSIERKAQIDVVSDYLLLAQDLLENEEIHPAGPAMIIGASLEEFLRNWIEDEKIAIAGKPTIDSYSTALRSSEKIDKQDVKDITSWGGIRNDAAHGHWDKVKDREKIGIMLQGVNFFMRKYSPGNRNDK